MSILNDIRKKVEKTLSPEQPQRSPRFIKQYDDKTRFSLIGTVGSGKTTICANLLVTAQTKSNEEPNFYCRVIEHKSNIRVAASNLRHGKFPPKTIPTGSSTYESGLELRWKTRWGGEKYVHIPIIDVAGEDIQYMLEDYNMEEDTSDKIDYNRLKDLIHYIKESEGFIIVLPAPRAFIGANTQIEPEPEDLAADPDVNLSRLLEQIINYKREHRGKAIKFIAVVITKYDLFQNYANKNRMNLYEQGGIENFMRTFFPDTNMQLKYYKDKNLVKFYPSYVTVEYNEKGETLYWNAPDSDFHGTPVVARIPKQNIHKYAESSYFTLFDDLEPFAS